jgi:Kelch motif/Galactose oxidase, central domain
MTISMRAGAATLLALLAVAAVGIGGAAGVGASTGSWSTTGSMTLGRQLHTATLLADGRVLAAGGVTPSTTATAELYDPSTGTWTPAANMNQPRSRHIAVRLPDGRVLVAGGRFAGVSLASAELYDPVTDTWSPTASMSVTRDNFTGTALADGRVLVTGGVGGDGSGAVVEKSAEIYDPSLGQWTPAGKMANHRFNHAAALLADGRVLVAGGSGTAGDCVYFQSTDVFDPVTGDWEAADPMHYPRGLLALAVLPDGRALAAAGLTLPANCKPPSSFPATNTSELFDPATERWSDTDSLASDRRAFGDVQLADGNVLVAGGRNSNAVALSSAELYDAGAGTWGSAGSMATIRIAPRLTLLADGRVLASGGVAPPGVFPASAELYTP